MVSTIRTGCGRNIFPKSSTGPPTQRHQNRHPRPHVPLSAERNSKHPDRSLRFCPIPAKRFGHLRMAQHVFLPRFPFIDIDRIRWVRAGLKAFKHYIRENGLPDLIHAHCMNYAGILAQKISEKYGIPYVLTEHSSTIHHARSDPSPPMAADGKSSGARLRTSRRQPPFRTRPATQIRLRMAVPPQHTGWNIQANI